MGSTEPLAAAVIAPWPALQLMALWWVAIDTMQAGRNVCMHRLSVGYEFAWVVRVGCARALRAATNVLSGANTGEEQD
jgi:hypothetical protein